MNGPTDRIEQARRDVERARGQLASTVGALQLRLKPANLMSNAWDGVCEKSGEMADDALSAVKQRPIAASGILAAIVLFLARDPLRRAAGRLLSGGDADDGAEAGTIEADLDQHDQDYDLTAPTVARSRKEGVNA